MNTLIFTIISVCLFIISRLLRPPVDEVAPGWRRVKVGLLRTQVVRIEGSGFKDGEYTHWKRARVELASEFENRSNRR